MSKVNDIGGFIFGLLLGPSGLAILGWLFKTKCPNRHTMQIETNGGKLKLYKCSEYKPDENPWCDVLLILADDEEEAKNIFENHFKILPDCVIEIEMSKGMIYRDHSH